MEACKRDTADTKFIKLRVKQRGQSMLLVLVDNTCVSAVTFEDGSVLFEQRSGVFYASVRLMLPQSCAPVNIGGTR